MAAREVIKAPVARLKPDPNQPRRDFPDEQLLLLGKSLLEGQVHPIIVCRENGNSDSLALIDGERRTRAAKLVGLETLDAVVIDMPTEEGGIVLRQLVSDVRESLRPIDKAIAAERLIAETGWTQEQVAARLAVSPPNLSQSLSLRRLSPQVQDWINKGSIGSSIAYQLVRALDELGPELAEQLAKEVVERKLTREAVIRRIRLAKEGKPASADAERRQAAFAAVLSDGRVVSIRGPGLDSLDAVIEVVEEFLAKARKARSSGTGLTTFGALLRDQASAKTNSRRVKASNGAAS